MAQIASSDIDCGGSGVQSPVQDSAITSRGQLALSLLAWGCLVPITRPIQYQQLALASWYTGTLEANFPAVLDAGWIIIVTGFFAKLFEVL